MFADGVPHLNNLLFEVGEEGSSSGDGIVRARSLGDLRIEAIDFFPTPPLVYLTKAPPPLAVSPLWLTPARTREWNPTNRDPYYPIPS
jgi:hypothetical protein